MNEKLLEFWTTKMTPYVKKAYFRDLENIHMDSQHSVVKNDKIFRQKDVICQKYVCQNLTLFTFETIHFNLNNIRIKCNKVGHFGENGQNWVILGPK